MLIDYSTYLILDEGLCPADNMYAVLQNLLDSGLTCVQLRMKQSSPQIVINVAQRLLTLLRPKNIPFIINDHVAVALAVDADGVHIGQSDMHHLSVKRILGNNRIIGLSIENIRQAEQFANCQVDYFGVGPVFATSTKSDAAPVLGIADLQAITALLKKPVVAIGGINQQNVTSVWRCGVAGVAYASVVLCADSPKTILKNLSRIAYSYREVV